MAGSIPESPAACNKLFHISSVDSPFRNWATATLDSPTRRDLICGIAIIFRFAWRVSRLCERDAEASSDEFEAALLLRVNLGRGSPFSGSVRDRFDTAVVIPSPKNPFNRAHDSEPGWRPDGQNGNRIPLSFNFSNRAATNR